MKTIKPPISSKVGGCSPNTIQAHFGVRIGSVKINNAALCGGIYLEPIVMSKKPIPT